jgi:hypothetical protein
MTTILELEAAKASIYLAVNSLEEHADEMPKNSRDECARRIRGTALDALRDLDFRRQYGASKINLFLATDSWIQKINSVKEQFCEIKHAEELHSIDEQLEELTLHTPPHHQPKHVTKDYFKEALQGAFAHHVVDDFLGKPSAIAFELVSGSMLAKPEEKSKNPVRDSVVSAASHLTLLEGTALVIGESCPAYQALAGVHFTGMAAHAAMGPVRRVQSTYCPKEEAELSVENHAHNAEGGLTPCQSARAAETILHAAQKPSEWLHEAHHSLVAGATKTLDALGMTQDNIKESAQKAATVLEEHPPIFD